MEQKEEKYQRDKNLKFNPLHTNGISKIPLEKNITYTILKDDKEKVSIIHSHASLSNEGDEKCHDDLTTWGDDEYENDKDYRSMWRSYSVWRSYHTGWYYSDYKNMNQVKKIIETYNGWHYSDDGSGCYSSVDDDFLFYFDCQ